MFGPEHGARVGTNQGENIKFIDPTLPAVSLEDDTSGRMGNRSIVGPEEKVVTPQDDEEEKPTINAAPSKVEDLFTGGVAAEPWQHKPYSSHPKNQHLTWSVLR